MKGWKLIFIPVLLVILALGVAFAINWWEDTHTYPGKRASTEVEMRGIADWAVAEQGVEVLGEYTFVTAPEIDKKQIKKVYTYHLSDGSVFGHFVYREKQQDQNRAPFVYAQTLVESEAAHLGKACYFETSGFFVIAEDPMPFRGYYSGVQMNHYYRG